MLNSNVFSLFLYEVLLYVLYPVIYCFLLIRKARGKEDKDRFCERFGKATIKRPDGEIVWINAVSNGEINPGWPVIERLLRDSNYTILITTTTVNSARAVAKKIASMTEYKGRVLHQFYPIDVYHIIKRFLNYWKPSILINIENEVWVNTFSLTHKVCPVFMLNAKMSKKSFKFWYKCKGLKESALCNVDVCLAQSKIDYKRFIKLGIQSVDYVGNMKFAVNKLEVNRDFAQKLEQEIGERKHWVANCTHRGEEEIILQVHKELKKKYPDLLTTIVLRHVERCGEVIKLIEVNGLKYCQTTTGDTIEKDTDIFIHDKMGSLGSIFEVNDIIFMAGSLQQNIGGHTPAECIKQHCCVVTGPYMHNNRSLFDELKECDGCIILEDNKAETLASTIDKLLSEPELVNTISSNAYTRSLQSTSIIGAITAKILSTIRNRI